MRQTSLAELVSPVGFLLVLGCFWLPFIQFHTDSRHGNQLGYTGLDIATGATREVVFGAPAVAPGHAQETGSGRQSQAVESRRLAAPTSAQVCAVAALSIAVAGVALLWSPRRAVRRTASMATAIAGAVLVAVSVWSARMSMFELLASDPRAKSKFADPGTGFVLALALLGALALGNLVAGATGRAER